MNKTNALYTVGALNLLGWFVWSIFVETPTVYDPITHCQAGKNQPTIAVLIDPSTPFSVTQQGQSPPI